MFSHADGDGDDDDGDDGDGDGVDCLLQCASKISSPYISHD